ncbi:hypothetical protein GOP47_0010096 [Adiantum capillus-veneris]|uniref:Uncharacterized protein n=1 Tax=Adiantum capillus-veneris TaxID=13818 RepID=A0A9D4UUS8_ADICA|nr:hypothetical protein GOP47_0010096 [Adiantum capillus-veneris]
MQANPSWCRSAGTTTSAVFERASTTLAGQSEKLDDTSFTNSNNDMANVDERAARGVDVEVVGGGAEKLLHPADTSGCSNNDECSGNQCCCPLSSDNYHWCSIGCCDN